MSVIEPGGKMHSFEIEHILLRSIVSWEANEIDSESRFRLLMMERRLRKSYSVKSWMGSVQKRWRSIKVIGELLFP